MMATIAIMKLVGKQITEIELDAVDAAIKLKEAWTSTLEDVVNKDAFIRDGMWCVHDRYGMDQRREPTKSEQEVFDAFMTIIRHMREIKLK